MCTGKKDWFGDKKYFCRNTWVTARRDLKKSGVGQIGESREEKRRLVCEDSAMGRPNKKSWAVGICYYYNFLFLL